MMAKKNKNDHRFARGICDALRSGQKEAIEKVYNRFHQLFLLFAIKRLQGFSNHAEHDALSVLDDFWVELLPGEYICKYDGGGTLKNYLMMRLKDRIIDQIRRLIQPLPDVPPPPRPDPRNIREVRKLLNRSLLELAEKYPTDAHYIKMYLDGMTYKEMAEVELAGASPDEETVRKKANAIKVQFTRKGTGSLIRFKEILIRNMAEDGYDKWDLLRSSKML